ncbi:radical SAM/SPASM domain-containing protein [Desulfoplanes sp.]
MNAKDFITHIYPKTLGFKMAYHGLIKPIRPITLTFSVTNRCQSRCKTCGIWKIYPNRWQDPSNELKLDEIEKIFTSIGSKIYFFNLSGGEPFLRDDLPEIVEAAVNYLKPAIIHSPTNAIATKRVVQGTRKILEMLKSKGLHTPVTIKPSLDGVGKLHDEIRGVPGNWEKLMATISELKKLEGEYDNFHLEIGTVVSNFNKDHLDEIEDFVHKLGVQSYRNEIAEQREEFFNIGDPITPTGEEYAELMQKFARKIRHNIKNKKKLARITESLRLVYYELVSKIVVQNKQVIPCYAGISNVHLTPHAELWPCCVLGYAKSLGNVRNENYDFWKVWHSQKGNEIRKYIKNKECACPLANQAYSNIICDYNSLFNAFKKIFIKI